MQKLYLSIISKILLPVLSATLFFTSCTSLQESSKYSFSEGVYKANISREPAAKVYVDMGEESLRLYPAQDYRRGQAVQLDTTTNITLAIPEELDAAPGHTYTFSKPSFDLDVLTIPFKYRPGTAGIPNQLNTTFQGALFIGARSDVFRINYKATPLGNHRRFVNHFGYSVGFFSGIGATTVNEAVTGGQVGYEYEGVVLLNGIAGIVGINNFTFGLALGFDHLLDKYRHDWIYQRKPWLGLAFGLNLN
ncbi:hypothetical protein I0P70_03315 [Pontibacter sp. FD36]|uniref:hypothetical protein n=1 Tax=Pontibacter sp. FD36 TaxID=2789860 RepID=UPI0018AB4905|nr:hypothetical protein [Pontibacter sp. FD36]MBF8962265.1 hypothetical protein [Pontibacter sp. FD36]